MQLNKVLLPLCGCALAVNGFAQQQQRPNILFCIADDASMWSFGAYGDKYINTPAIDDLASKGAVFDNAFTENPKSAPSRACLVTGKHSWQLKEATDHYCHFPAEFKFYPHLLMDNGYYVGYTGKGWGPGIYDTKYNPAGPEYNDIKMKVPFKGIRPIDYASNFENFLNKNTDNKPFCFWLGCFEPHRFYEKDSWKKAGKDLDSVKVQPYFPDNDIVRGDLQDYAVEVEWYDKHVGRAIELLKQKGLLENTIIIVTSDHGMPFPRVKAQIYEEGFHVPFIVYWNEKIKAGRHIEDFIGFQDVAPTLMELAGVKPDKQMTGKSFADVLTDKKQGAVTDKSRDHILLIKERHDVGRANQDGVNLGYPVRAIRNNQYLYVHNCKPERWPAGNPEYGLKNCDESPTKSYLVDLDRGDKDYKYYDMAFGMRPEEELYNIVDDKYCLKNLAKDKKYASIMKKMRKQMESELKANGDPRMFGQGDVFDKYEYVGKKFDYSKTISVK